MYWLNGKPSTQVSLNDRSFQYGDGCFTTILTRDGVLQYFPLHIKRVNACLDMLGISPPDWERVKTWLENAALQDEYAGLKLHVTRGEGGRGYSPNGVLEPNITISCFTYPEHYKVFRRDGVELGVCHTPLGINPTLAGHKHNNRLEQVLLKAEMDKAGNVDGIAFDIHGHVIETTMANIFWCKSGTLYTPELKQAGVSGIVRQLVLQHANDHGITAEVGKFQLETLLNADEIFVTNSILGVAPVSKIGNQAFGIGHMSRVFQERYFQC